MQPLGMINRQDQLAALADEHRMAILRRLMCGPSTISRLGRDFGKHAAWIRHHVKRLEAVELIELAGVKKTRNYTEKFYRATSTALAVHMLVSPDSGERKMMVALGSDDFALQLLTDEYNALAGDQEIMASSVGSLDGLIALRQGLADVAGCHLFDAAAGDYNVPYLRHLFPDRSVDVVTLAHREQGLMSAPGDTRVRAVEDIAEPGIRFVNRNPGSGTRIWFDARLGDLGIPASAVTGYDTVMRTHGDVALAVATGQADVGLGIRAAAEAHGLEFAPLFTERYDLVFNADRSHGDDIQRLLERLSSRGFKNGVGGLSGYDASHTGEETRIAV
ncbi:MAG: helix-turn-helix domain-containing protein [Coriobacteriia bacterium]|nr:helix-turn-helix domain-containing protein [Coriobacteriia bacterium]